MPERAEYVAQRVLARMQQRGEPMLLRRVSLLAGPEPFRNPPDLPEDLTGTTIVAGSNTGGQNYVGISGPTIMGRLVVGDQISVGATLLTVMTMPVNVMTDADGIPVVDGSGNPTFGSPPVYHVDSLAWDNALKVVPVLSLVDPATLIGQAVTAFRFANDANVFGNPMSVYQRTALGWTEVTDLTMNIAGYNVTPPPKVNDLLVLTAEGNARRAIVDIGSRFSNGQNFLFSVRAN